MEKSIITEKRFCFLCGSPYNLETHHCVFGRFRKLSDKYGLIVPLCRGCHWEVHHSTEQAAYLKEVAQRAFDEKYGKGKFFEIFGVNFLDEEYTKSEQKNAEMDDLTH